MLHFVIGLPGPFATWCETAVVALAEQARGPAPLLRADTPEELARAVIRSGSSQAIVSARYPGGQLRAALLQSQSPFLLVLDDPRRALMTLTTSGMEFFGALRLVASACAALRDCAALPGALVLQAGPCTEKTMAIIARHMEFAAENVAAPSPPAMAAQGALNVREWWHALPHPARSAAEGALAPYEDTGRSAVPIRWQPDLFWRGEQPGTPLRGPIDITGRSRVLFAGPGITLPHGAWRLSARLAFSVHAAAHEFLLEVVAGRVLAACTITPPEAGAFEAVASIVIDDSVDHPVLLRLSLKRAAFDGEVALENVALTPESA